MAVRCAKCKKSFPKSMFDDVSADECICAICISVSIPEAEIKELKEEVKEMREEIKSLHQIIKIMNEEKCKCDQILPNKTAPARAVEDNQCLQPLAATTQEEVEDVLDKRFQLPSRKRIARRYVSRITSSYLPVSNFFESLAKKTDDGNEDNAALFGDSHARETDENFCKRRHKKRRRTSIPGGNIEDISAAVRAEVKEEDQHVIIMASGNDVANRRISELRGEYKNVLQFLVNKRKGVICAGVMPRPSWNRYEREQAERCNQMLRSLCDEVKVSYLDLWCHFMGQQNLYANDGVHLNCVGNVRLGRVLDEGLSRHRANFQLHQVAESLS